MKRYNLKPEEILVVESVLAEEVDDLMSDEAAEEALDESEKFGGTGKMGIVNVDSINGVFENHDTVTLDVLKEKKLVNRKIGRVKVLARGKLDKSLTVEADAFSMQAIKMITLTGGHAVHLKDPNSIKYNRKDEKVQEEKAENIVEAEELEKVEEIETCENVEINETVEPSVTDEVVE